MLSVGAIAGAAALVGPAAAAAKKAAEPNQRAQVRALFSGLIGESAALAGWQVKAVYPVGRGAIPVLLSTPAGEPFQVEVLRAGAGAGEPVGVAGCDDFSIFLINQGDGSTASEQAQGLGARALAAALAERAGLMRAAGDPLPDLMSFAERARAFPDGRFSPRT